MQSKLIIITLVLGFIAMLVVFINIEGIRNVLVNGVILRLSAQVGSGEDPTPSVEVTPEVTPEPTPTPVTTQVITTGGGRAPVSVSKPAVVIPKIDLAVTKITIEKTSVANQYIISVFVKQ